MKAQTQIIQFILFFLISLTVFSLVSSYIFSFSNFSQDRLLSHYRELLSSYISSIIISSYTGCKYCNTSNVSYAIAREIFDNFHDIGASGNAIYVKSVPFQKQVLSSIHNLNHSTQFTGFFPSGVTPSYFGLNKSSIIVISFNRIENKFIIGW